MNNMQNIDLYCPENVFGWERLPEYLLPPPKGMEGKQRSFVNLDSGLQLTASIREINTVFLHVSIGFVQAVCPDKTPEELNALALEQISDILKLFFPTRRFAQVPDEPHRPYNHHYFCPLEN